MFPSNFFSLYGEFKTLLLDLFGFETFLEIVTDCIGFDEASRLMFDKVDVFFEFSDFFGDESFVEMGVCVLLLLELDGNVWCAGLVSVFFAGLANEGWHGSGGYVDNLLITLLVDVAACGNLILGLLLGCHLRMSLGGCH